MGRQSVSKTAPREFNPLHSCQNWNVRADGKPSICKIDVIGSNPIRSSNNGMPNATSAIIDHTGLCGPPHPIPWWL